MNISLHQFENPATPCTVTVVVSAYNAEAFIAKCLTSLTEQTLASFEVLAIDDGSSDGTLAKIEEFAARDSRITALHHDNRGLSATMNRGLREARGDYITFFDADDYADPDMLEVMHESAVAHDADVVVCGQEIVTESGTSLKKTSDRFRGFYDGYDYFQIVLRADNSLMFHDKLFRRRLLLENNIWFEEGRFYEDMDAGVKVMLYANRVFVMNRFFYKYVWHQDAITKRFSKQKVDDFAESILRTRTVLQDAGMFDLHYIDFLQGVLARTLNFVDQAADYPAVDDGRHVFEHIVGLVERLKQEGVITRESLRVMTFKSGTSHRKYSALLDLAERPNDALLDLYRQARKNKDTVSVKPRPAAKSAPRHVPRPPHLGPEDRIARKVKNVRLRYFPVGSAQRRTVLRAARWLNPAAAAGAIRDVLMPRKTIAKPKPTLQSPPAPPAPSTATPPKRVPKEIVLADGTCFYSINGKTNLVVEEDIVMGGRPSSLPDISTFRDALFFYVEDVSVAQQIERWFQFGFLSRQKTLVVNRQHRQGYGKILAFLLEKGFNFVCIPNAATLDFTYLQHMFYPFPDSLANITFVEHRECVHFSLGHGESDKFGSVDPLFRIYDFVLVSGVSALDRFVNMRVFERAAAERKVLPIGMPYLEEPQRQRFDRDADAPGRVVVYMPTWEQLDRGEQYSSLVDGFGHDVIGRLLADPSNTVYFKPHPITGRRDKSAITEIIDIIRSFASHPSFVFVHESFALDADRLKAVLDELACNVVEELPDIAATDLMLTDVSSVIANAVHARVPYLVLLPDATAEAIERDRRWGQFVLVSRSPRLLRSELSVLSERVAYALSPQAASEYEETRGYVVSPTSPSLRGKASAELLSAVLGLAAEQKPRCRSLRFGLDPAYKRLHRVSGMAAVPRDAARALSTEPDVVSSPIAEDSE